MSIRPAAESREAPSPRPLKKLVVAIGDRPFDPDGFWPADVSLFTTVAGLDEIVVLATGGVLDAGYLDRLQLAFVEIDLIDDPAKHPRAAAGPTLIVPGDDYAFRYRDREDELEGVARRLKAGAATTAASLERTGLVVARPLPYLYLAREVFAGAGLSFEALDTLPLAAEPYAAAVDVVLECARPTSPAARRWRCCDRRIFDSSSRAMKSIAHRSRSWMRRWRSSVTSAASIALPPWRQPGPARSGPRHTRHLRRRRRSHRCSNRGRSSIRSSCYADFSTVTIAITTSAAGASAPPSPMRSMAWPRRIAGTIPPLPARSPSSPRRFADGLARRRSRLRPARGGLRILDAQAARFADLDDVQIMGLVEGEWPERPRRNVFYPRGLIAQLEPARPEKVAVNDERDQVRSARAAFRDLAGLARLRTRVSTFSLEAESVVEPSSFIEDLPSFGLRSETGAPDADAPTFEYEVLAHDPAASGSRWAASPRRKRAA